MNAKPDKELPALQWVRESLRDIRFGTLTLVVQDGQVVQVEKTERKRLIGHADKASC